MDGQDRVLTAIVQKICPRGRHGPYAVAACEEIEALITFALSDDVWHEKRLPEKGDVVLLSDVRRRPAGWRAHEGRFLRPSRGSGQK